MKMIMSTLIATGLLLGAARAEFDPFGDQGQVLPRSERISCDDHRQALPRTSSDAHRDALPFADDIFPDIVVATP